MDREGTTGLTTIALFTQSDGGRRGWSVFNLKLALTRVCHGSTIPPSQVRMKLNLLLLYLLRGSWLWSPRSADPIWTYREVMHTVSNMHCAWI